MVAFCCLMAGGAQAEGDPLAALMAEIGSGPGGACRVAIAEHRITEWRGGPFVLPEFASVEEIMAPHDQVERLIGTGCDATFMWSFMSCTQLHDPNGIRISPRRPSAPSEASFARVLERCFAELEEWGLRP